MKFRAMFQPIEIGNMTVKTDLWYLQWETILQIPTER